MAGSSSCSIHAFSYSLCSMPKTHTRLKAPISSIPLSQLLRPGIGTNCKSFTSIRLRSSYKKNKSWEHWFRVLMISCLMEDNSEVYSVEEASIDLKLPRRSLLATFTCNACGTRSERLINRLAYERGLVYVQCSGCSQYHKLVDNLGLVVEYNLQEGINLDASTEQP